MKPKQTFVLLLVLIALCAAYWAVGKLQQKAQQQIQEAKHLFTFEASAVKSITLKRVDGPLCAADRDPVVGWKFTKPNATIQALPQVWDRIGLALAGLMNERVIDEEPKDLKAYGLDEPRLFLHAIVDGHEPVSLFVGSPEPTQVSRFARLENGPVFLLNSKAFFELDRDLDFLRYRFLVDNRDAPLLRIEYTRIWTGRDPLPEGMKTAPEIGEESTKTIVERKSVDAAWHMISPVEATADQEAANALATELQFATGDGYIDAPADLADYGLKPANARLVLTDNAKGLPQTILLGDPDKTGEGRLFAKREGMDAVFTLNGTLLGKVPRTPDSLRERRLLTQQARDIERVDYSSNAGAFAIARDAAGGWTIEGMPTSEIAQERVADFFTKLKTVALQTFAPQADPVSVGINTPDVTLRITLKDEPKPREIKLKASEADAAMFYATQDTDTLGMLSADQARGLLVGAETFRSLALMKFEKNDATKIVFTMETQPYAFEKVHGLWVVRTPENHRLTNQSDADRILGALASLSASKNTTVTPIGEQGAGLEKPVLAITVTTVGSDGQEQVHGALQIGKMIPGQNSERYCSIVGREGVFTVRQEVLEKIRDALHGVVANPQ